MRESCTDPLVVLATVLSAAVVGGACGGPGHGRNGGTAASGESRVSRSIRVSRSAARGIPLLTDTKQGEGVTEAALAGLRWTVIRGAPKRVVYVHTVNRSLGRDAMFECGGRLFARRPDAVLRLEGVAAGTVLMTGEPDVEVQKRHVAAIHRPRGARHAWLRCGPEVKLPRSGVVSVFIGHGTERARRSPGRFAWLAVAHEKMAHWTRAPRRVSSLQTLDRRQLVWHFPVVRLQARRSFLPREREQMDQLLFRGTTAGLFVYATRRLQLQAGYRPRGYVRKTDVIELGEPLLILKRARPGHRVVLAADGMRFEVADPDLGVRPPRWPPAWPSRVRGCWPYETLKAGYATARLRGDIQALDRALAAAWRCHKRLQMPPPLQPRRTDRFMVRHLRRLKPPDYVCPAVRLPPGRCTSPALRREALRVLGLLSTHRRKVLGRILSFIRRDPFHG